MQNTEMEITEAEAAVSIQVQFVPGVYSGADHWTRFFQQCMEFAEVARQRAAAAEGSDTQSPTKTASAPPATPLLA